MVNGHKQVPAISCLQVLIAVAAHAIGVRHTLAVENIPDLMGLMAIHTGRENVRFFLPEFATNGLAMNLFDLGMTLGASGRDVAPANRRLGIGVRQDAMRRMARYARGRNDQTLLEHSLAVDALGIVLQNVVLINVAVQLDRRALAVAAATDERDVERGDRGATVLNRQDIVIAVAVYAVRGERIAARDCLAMKRGSMLFLLVAVAGSALHASERRTVGQLFAFEVGVARRAG